MRSLKLVKSKICKYCETEFTPTREDKRIKCCSQVCNTKLWEVNNPEKKRRNVKQYAANHPALRKAIKLKHYYGMTLKQYEDIKIAQNGVCRICKKTCKTGRDLAVDHCHKTGKIRGLLCHNCNNILGAANDTVDILSEAIIYLKEHQDVDRGVQ